MCIIEGLLNIAYKASIPKKKTKTNENKIKHEKLQNIEGYVLEHSFLIYWYE
jgi:hypothetical protein